MTRKIPEDAFERYVAMGAQRSFQALADELGVTKRAVSKCAAREGWSQRLARIDAEARKRSDEKITETLEQMRERHLATLKAMHTRALAALRQYPLTSGMDAMRAAEMAIKLERLVAGEPTDRSAVSIEEIIKQEMRELLVVVDDEDPDGGDGHDEPDREAT
jgi:predicted transcriptional regulator